MISTPKINPVIGSIFTTVTTESEIQIEHSKKIYGKYPYGRGLGYFNETDSRSIENFSDRKKLRLKTIIAHMCEVGGEIAKTSRSISICEKSIRYAKEKIDDEELRQHFCTLSERELEVTHQPKNGQLLLTMSILVALLIKDSYCMDRESRLLIIDFLMKAEVLVHLDKATRLAGASFGFQSIYFASAPSSASRLLTTSIRIAQDEDIFIPIFALNSHELKPKNLPDKLEMDWPL